MLKKLWKAIVARCEGTLKSEPKHAPEGVNSKQDSTQDFLPQKPLGEINDWIDEVKLTPEQITEILQKEKEDRIMLEVLRTNKLDPSQEELLVLKRNTLLLETYLSPQGFLDPDRILSPKAEEIYILSMLKAQKAVGIELFKTYVDNAKKTILTDKLLEKAIEVIALSCDQTTTECFSAKYLLSKAYFNENQELYLLTHCSYNYIEEYISQKQLYSDKAQIYLIENFYPIAKFHQEEYGFRPKAIQPYHTKRKEELQQLHPLSAVP